MLLYNKVSLEIKIEGYVVVELRKCHGQHVDRRCGAIHIQIYCHGQFRSYVPQQMEMAEQS